MLIDNKELKKILNKSKRQKGSILPRWFTVGRDKGVDL